MAAQVTDAQQVPALNACLPECAAVECRLQLEAGEGSGTGPAHPVQPCCQGGEV